MFGDGAHAPALMHPGGMQWVIPDFRDEAWVGIYGYQSGHGDDDRSLRWITEGPPATDWAVPPIRPFINLEPPYENHLAYQSREPIPASAVRRAVYWSLLNTPTAGVSYGGHGVWGWDDGSGPPADHLRSGTPLPWRDAIAMPGAEQMKYVAGIFSAIDYWRLRPAQALLIDQPGIETAREFISAAATPAGDLLVIYTPVVSVVTMRTEGVPPGPAIWMNPRTGERTPAAAIVDEGRARFTSPGAGDWLLVVSSKPLR